jgi:diacylglycerol kinase family enzyme
MRVAVIGNPEAGRGGRGDPMAEAERALREAGAEPSLRRVQGPGLADAARAAAEECDVVAALGGDGTVSAIAGALAGSPTPLLVLPAGTLNHFAKDLGLPSTAAGAALLVRDGEHRRIDVAEVNGHVFVNNSSIGAYPLTVALRERIQQAGAGGKWVAMGRAALRTFRRYPTLDVRLAGDDGEIALETPFVFVGNNEYGGEGARPGERARLDGGRLDVLTAEATTRRHAIRIAALAAMGRIDAASAVWRGEPVELTVATDRASLPVSLDGEVERLETPLRYRSRPGALVVIGPPVRNG